MNFFGAQYVSRYMILNIIAGGILMFCSVAMAAPESSKPGPLGLAVEGASSGIAPDYFRQAITDAINDSGIFSGIDSSDAADIIIPMIGADGVYPSNELSDNTPYVLKIRIIEVDAPAFSIRMTVSMNVVWTLYRTADKATLMHEIIPSSYTGRAFEGGIIGANRVRAGTEGATRENILIGMEMLESVYFEPEKESG
jgi:hypothetical protein|tara:strand:+ start:400 stop:990 length:591 start_codon:yes stop_codon:yes gene_type:complete